MIRREFIEDGDLIVRYTPENDLESASLTVYVGGGDHDTTSRREFGDLILTTRLG